MPALLSVDEALALVLARVPAPRTERLPLDVAAGRVLAEDVAAREDFPAFPRSRVDGWAVRAAEAHEGAELAPAHEVAAGVVAPPPLPPGAAARVFTGATVPPGADAVVMQEDCARDATGRVRVGRAAAPGQHVVPVAYECARGALVAARGTRVSPAVAGALAAAGAAHVAVHAVPAAHVVATGDELVAVEDDPPPGRIRNSNAPALAAALAAFGARPAAPLRARDDADELDAAVRTALAGDVCVLTGGVSVGDFDLVPATLERAGVERVLHGVRLQPGKPLWFGVRGRTLVFGLPGNPVSSLVTATLFVRPAVRALLGLPSALPGPTHAVLEGALPAGGARRRCDPVRLSHASDGRVTARPVRYRGSGDVFGFAAADALAVVPEHARAPQAGDVVEVVRLSGSDA